MQGPLSQYDIPLNRTGASVADTSLVPVRRKFLMAAMTFFRHAASIDVSSYLTHNDITDRRAIYYKKKMA